MADLIKTAPSILRPATLASPVRGLLRPTLKIDAEDSLALASIRFRQNGSSVLPVVTDDRLVGVITDSALAAALGSAVETTDPLSDWVEPAETIFGYETGAEALRRCSTGKTLVVIDDQERLLGLISAADLWPRRRPPIRPTYIGGMATPFGVYLTSGNVSGGAPKWALAATGAVMSLMMFVALWAGTAAVHWAQVLKLGSDVEFVLDYGVTGLVFLVLMRLVPLSGTHGAEHQVVHAIEREEELAPSVIRRMPRVHPRCGTNLVAALGIFMITVSYPWTDVFGDSGPEALKLRVLVSALITAILWRPLGSFLQKYFTTKEPSDKQLAGGIKAAEDLLTKYATSRNSWPSIWQRIWHSGIFHVYVGGTAVALLVTYLGPLLKLDLNSLVFSR